MPGLVADGRVGVFRKGHLKAVGGGVLLKPLEGGGGLEAVVGVGAGFAFVDEVYGVAGVVFAVAGRGADFGARGGALAAFGFDVEEEAVLVFDGAEGGGDAKLDAFGFGASDHFVDGDLNGGLKLEFAVGV